MKSEADPIAEEEWLLRRVHRTRFRTDKVPVLSPNAFEPRGVNARDPDTDGISLYREACLTDPTEVLATMDLERRHEQGIVRISVRLLKSLGLSVQSKPDEKVRGHVVNPELNAVDYSANKAGFTAIKKALATEASKDENIVKNPE
jgi:hypothetical protein